MKILLQNKTFRTIYFSRIINTLGSGLFNLIFVVYAATYEHAAFYISISTMIMFLPNVLSSYVGHIADKVVDKAKATLCATLVQVSLFVLLACLITQKSLLIFVILTFVNLLCDVLADYKNMLMLPVIQQKIEKEKIQEVFGTFQATTAVILLASQPIGLLLLSVLNHQYNLLGLVNAGVYLMSGLILLSGLEALNIKVSASEKNKTFNLKESWSDVKQVFLEDQSIKNIVVLLGGIILTNFLYSSFISLLDLVLLKHNTLHSNFGMAIALVSISSYAGMIIGSLVMNDWFKKINLSQLILVMSTTIAVTTFIFPQSTVGGLLCIFISGYLSSKAGPKLSALMMSSVASENIGKISGAIGTLLTIGNPVGSIFFIFLANAINPVFAISLIGMLEIILFLWVFVANKKEKKVEMASSFDR